MRLAPFPSQVCWRHRGVRDGFEVLWPISVGDGARLRGSTTGIEDDAGWTVGYDIEIDAGWRTRTAVVRVESSTGHGEVLLERHDDSRWSIDGVHRPDLDGIDDVDLESSAATNTLPLHRLALEPGKPLRAEAAFVRLDLQVERLVQTYELVESTDDAVLVAYTSPAFDVACTLVYDRSGLVVDYPELAERHA